MDLISCLRAGALLGLRDATAFTPAPAGVEDQDQTQDGQQKGDHPALRGGGWHLEHGQKKKGEEEKKSRERRESQRGEQIQRILPSRIQIKVKAVMPTAQFEKGCRCNFVNNTYSVFK